MLKAVLFDLDGTLLDRDTSLQLFVDDQYERLRAHVSHIPKAQYVERFIELDDHGYVWKDRVYAQLIQQFNIHMESEALLADYMQHFPKHCVAFPHVHEMLHKLKQQNVALGIITNGFGHFQMANIQALRIESYFDEIVVSEWAGMKKPHADIFNNTLRKLQVDASESVFIGDHLENDVRGAQRVGMKAIWKRCEPMMSNEPDAIIDDYTQLPFILRSLFDEQ